MLNRFSSRWIDTSKYKIKEIILSVVGARIKSLVPSNKAETFYECLCPFHKERTPSFKIYYNKFLKGWRYKCFGCGASGDVFTFLMRFDRCEFWEALKYIKNNFILQTSESSISSLKYIQLEIPFLPY